MVKCMITEFDTFTSKYTHIIKQELTATMRSTCDGKCSGAHSSPASGPFGPLLP
jgi:hypothetical protein